MSTSGRTRGPKPGNQSGPSPPRSRLWPVSEQGDGRKIGIPPTPRAIVVVIDACGVGALPDASLYGDEGTNTLLHVAEAVGGLELPALAGLGLGSILRLPGVAAVSDPATHGRLRPL